MKKEKKTMSGGVVVNVASVNGLDPDKSSPVLTASKYGVVGLTKALGVSSFEYFSPLVYSIGKY